MRKARDHGQVPGAPRVSGTRQGAESRAIPRPLNGAEGEVVSSKSDQEIGNCRELVDGPAIFPVRDEKKPADSILLFPFRRLIRLHRRRDGHPAKIGRISFY